MTGMRRAIARNMHNSHMTSPTVSFNLGCDVSELAKFRQRLKAEDIKVSYTDILVKLTALALREFPLLNCSVDGDNIIYKNYVNIGVAVALDNGLVVPNVPDADMKSLREISAEVKELANLARTGGLPMDRLKGGTFTITNLGMYGSRELHADNQPARGGHSGCQHDRGQGGGRGRRDLRAAHTQPLTDGGPQGRGRFGGGAVPAEAQEAHRVPGAGAGIGGAYGKGDCNAEARPDHDRGHDRKQLQEEGEAVQEGEKLFSVSTDKLTNDVEATASGVLLRVLVAAGGTVPCLTPVAVIGARGESVSPVPAAAGHPAEAEPGSSEGGGVLVLAAAPAAMLRR